MSPVFFLLLAVLGAVFVYTTRRAMRQTTFKPPTPQDAADDLEQAVLARQEDAPAADPHPARQQPPRTSHKPSHGLETLTADWGRTPVSVPAVPPRSMQRPPHTRPLLQTAAAAPRRARGHRARDVFRSRENLHRAVVAMTVLGPCRALDPYNPPDRSSDRR